QPSGEDMRRIASSPEERGAGSAKFGCDNASRPTLNGSVPSHALQSKWLRRRDSRTGLLAENHGGGPLVCHWTGEPEGKAKRVRVHTLVGDLSNTHDEPSFDR